MVGCSWVNFLLLLVFQALGTQAAVAIEVLVFHDPPTGFAGLAAFPATLMSGLDIFFQAAPAISGAADIAGAGAVVAKVPFAAMAEIGSVTVDQGAAIGTWGAFPVIQAHKWGMGVVGVQDAVQGQEGIDQSSLAKGGGDWDGGIPGADFAVSDVGMGDFVIAGRRMGIQRGYFKHR